ncbi:MAG: MBOAT family protein [Sphingobacteriales bacterium]|nr:MBOAT family protein [Sphingobacteriales bacterium]
MIIEITTETAKMSDEVSSMLAFFKYSPLFAQMLSDELTFSGSVKQFLLTIPLPIGISFYTFEGISLLVDVLDDKYSLKVRANSYSEHFLKTSFFISFFPHLIAGPILKAHDFYPQMGQKNLQDINWQNVVKCLILGFFLKMVVADNLNDYTSLIQYPFFQSYSTFNLLMLLFAYSVQIFCDFAGYSLIALGLGYIFGYNLPVNFNFPYLSQSFSEFWTRWHISLSTWLKEYLYFPLGGNRKGRVRTYINLFLVMFLGGLWHGAAWSYAVWGTVHGLALGIERLVKDNVKYKAHTGLFRKIINTAFVFIVVTFLWLFFKLRNFNEIIAFLQSIATNINIKASFSSKELNVLILIATIVVYHLYYLLATAKLYIINSTTDYWVKISSYAILLFLILTNSGNQEAFIYFQF